MTQDPGQPSPSGDEPEEPMSDPFANMSIGAFEAILEDESDPRHDDAKREWEKTFGPVRNAILGSDSFKKIAHMQATLGQAFPKINFPSLLADGSMPTFSLLDKTPSTTVAPFAIQSPSVQVPPVPMGSTVGQLQLELLRDANSLGEQQRDELRAINEASDNAASAALDVAKGARLAAWFAVGLAAAGIVATIVVAIITRQ